MAWEATHLLPPVLLVLLASGSWGQKPEMLHKLEGEKISVRCRYQLWQDFNKVKAWCRRTTAYSCDIIVSSSGLQEVPRYSIQDYPSSGYFTVTVTDLRVEDSGIYWCGIYEPSRIFGRRAIHLVVSQASTLPTPRSTRGTTAWTSAISPVIDRSPAGNWDVISGVVVVAVLLLVLALLVILYLRKARGRARKGKDESHHNYDNISAQGEERAVRRQDPAPGQRGSQLSWGSDQQAGSGEDTGTICYASLTHLNHFGPEDSIYVNTHRNPKPMPDPLLAVEYASITGNRPQPSKSAAQEGEPRI